MRRSQELQDTTRKPAEHLVQLMLFAIELERLIEENEGLEQTIEDYRQKAIDMEQHHAEELTDIKEFFEATVREQAVSYDCFIF